MAKPNDDKSELNSYMITWVTGSEAGRSTMSHTRRLRGSKDDLSKMLAGVTREHVRDVRAWEEIKFTRTEVVSVTIDD